MRIRTLRRLLVNISPKSTNPLLYQPGKHMIGVCIAPGVGSILWLADAGDFDRLLHGCICLTVSL